MITNLVRVLIGSSLLWNLFVPLAVSADDGMAGWETYGSATTPFQIKYPHGWHVGSDPKTGQIDVKDSNGSQLSVLPFALESSLDASKGVTLLNAMLHSFAPDLSWSAPEVVDSWTLKSVHSSAKEKASALLVVQSASHGTIGELCVARVPANASANTATLMAQMMGSLQLHRSAPPKSGGSKELESDEESEASNSASNAEESTGVPEVSEQMMGSQLPPTPFSGYTTFTDPNENSFSVEVPAGWKVEGGLYRPISIDARPWVKATSPDNLMVAFIGDGKIPPYSMPTATGMALGFGVGRRYGSGEIRPYTPARKYVEQYVRNSLKNYISNIQVVESYDHPEVARAMNGTVNTTKSEASSIKFTGMYGEIPAVGYYLASTKATVAYGTGMWWVTLIAGELSAADRAQGGLGIILHMIETFKMNPVWQGRAIANAGEVSRNYTIQSQAVSRSIMNRYWSQQAANESIHSAYWNRQASQDRAANNFSDYIRGHQTVQDPNTGTQYKVDYGPQYHWIDQGGNITGTNHSSPGPEWTQLMNVP